MASRMVRPPTAFTATSRRLKRQRVGGADHRAFVKSLPCVITGATEGIEVAHVSYEDLRYGKLGRGKGMKEEDCWCVPLTAAAHRDQHQTNEEKWWRVYEIDPCRVALALWRCSGDYETAMIVLQHAREK